MSAQMSTFALPELEEVFNKHDFRLKTFSERLDEITADIVAVEKKFREHGVCIPFSHTIRTHRGKAWSEENNSYLKDVTVLSWERAQNGTFRLFYTEAKVACDVYEKIHSWAPHIVTFSAPFAETKAEVRISNHRGLAKFSESFLDLLHMQMDPDDYWREENEALEEPEKVTVEFDEIPF